MCCCVHRNVCRLSLFSCVRAGQYAWILTALTIHKTPFSLLHPFLPQYACNNTEVYETSNNTRRRRRAAGDVARSVSVTTMFNVGTQGRHLRSNF